jgi:predicted nucleic acid-binding protein
VNKALLDTDIFSEILKQKNPFVLSQARQYLAHHPQFTLSSLTVTEIVAGYRQAQRESQLQSFQAAIAVNEVLSFGPAAARLAGEILGELRRRGETIGHFDPMIAAIAITNGLVLVTGNTVHFTRIQQLGYGLTLDNWRDAPVL